MAASKENASARAAACRPVVDGYARVGTRVAGVPPRWDFPTSPYLGARFNECTDTMTVYFGGYSGITHYNIKWAEEGTACAPYIQCKQIEVGPGLRRIHRIGGNELASRPVLNVQACKRGGFLQSSSCTRWSPTIRFQTPLVGVSD
jgi:hypothetical protein